MPHLQGGSRCRGSRRWLALVLSMRRCGWQPQRHATVGAAVCTSGIYETRQQAQAQCCCRRHPTSLGEWQDTSTQPLTHVSNPRIQPSSPPRQTAPACRQHMPPPPAGIAPRRSSAGRAAAAGARPPAGSNQSMAGVKHGQRERGPRGDPLRPADQERPATIA